MGLCSSKKSLKVVHPLDVVPTDGATDAAPAPAAAEPVATPAPAALAPGPVATPTPAVPKAVVAKAKAKAKPTSLIKAIKVNDVTVVEEFLQAPDCNLEVLGMWDNTPLLAACMYGHSEVALKLLARGANVFAQNEHGATALHYSSVEGSLEVTKAILDSASSEVEKLVNSGAAKVYNRHLDCYGERTPLAAAAESGFEDSVALLLSAGARLDEADGDGRTALWLAARHSRLGVAQVLLKHGADAGHCDKEGTSVLGAATAAGNRCNDDLVLALLAVNGLDVNKTSGSPLFDAVKANKKSVAEALLTHGANANTPGPGGRTALHAACERGDEYLVQLLVRSRADPSIADAQGFTAFDLLRRRGLPDGKILAMFNLPAQSESDGGTGSAADG